MCGVIRVYRYFCQAREQLMMVSIAAQGECQNIGRNTVGASRLWSFSLTIFNPAKKIMIEIDINRIVLDSILSQPDEKKRLYSVIFYSRKFTVPKLNYDIYNKKLLIIVNSFKIQKIYLKKLKYTVKVYTDYKNLKSFTSIKVLNQK